MTAPPDSEADSEPEAPAAHPHIGPFASDAPVPLSGTSIEVQIGQARRRVDLADWGEVLVGRAPEVMLMIDDERVSRRHLKISVRDGVLYATDLGSRNGTFINGSQLTGERRLRGGDRIDVGPMRIFAGGRVGS